MANTTLPQTERTINAMLAAGWKRREFSVKTPYDRKRGHYMDTYIVIKCDLARALSMAEATVAHGLGVSMFRIGGQVRTMSVWPDGGGLVVRDVDVEAQQEREQMAQWEAQGLV